MDTNQTKYMSSGVGFGYNYDNGVLETLADARSDIKDAEAGLERGRHIEGNSRLMTELHLCGEVSDNSKALLVNRCEAKESERRILNKIDEKEERRLRDEVIALRFEKQSENTNSLLKDILAALKK
jgi:hypothetical protein